MKIGDKIRHYRHLLNISMDDLARTSGLTSAYIGRIERGEEKYNNPTIETLQALANALKVRVPDLLVSDPLDSSNELSISSKMDIGEKIKMLRELRGFKNTRDLAKICKNTSPELIYKLEKGLVS